MYNIIIINIQDYATYKCNVLLSDYRYQKLKGF